MSDILVSLYRILPNPYQTRLPRPADDSHVASLAADIAARGLLQVPLGRLVNDDGPITYTPAIFFSGDSVLPDKYLAEHGWSIQLAFGHNRLAAYRLLAALDPDNGWGRMPVRVAALDDQAMALAAWSENAQRQDLTPLEAALALARLITDFGWTQEQVAEHVGLARATVANKLRLLRLPEELQKKLHRGDLSERAALAILPVYELPSVTLERMEEKRQANDWTIRNLDEVLAHPDKKSAEARQAIRDAISHVTQPLVSARENEWGRGSFPVDREIAGVAAPACLECSKRLQETRCADGACFAQKQAVFESQELAFAVAATGLPAITNAALNALPWGAKKIFGAEDRAGLQRALDQRCPNLRLRYDREEPRPWELRVPDYPHAEYVCVHASDGLCECADGARAKREAKAKEKEERRKKEAAKLREATIKELTAALRAQDLGAMRAVLWHMAGNPGYHADRSDKIARIPDLGTICERIARYVLRDAVRWDYPPPEGCAAALAAWREKVGWGVPPGNPAATTREVADA